MDSQLPLQAKGDGVFEEESNSHPIPSSRRRSENSSNINSTLITTSSPPRPSGSSITGRTNLTTGLMRPDREAKGSLVIKAMKEKLASQRGVIKMGYSRTATSRGQVNRYVQDKRYFIGTLHLKIGELTDEIDRLNRLYSESIVEHGHSLVYEKRVKELAAEITDMQGTLIDLNIVADNMTFDNVQSIRNETKELVENNASMGERIENVFSDRLRKEEATIEIEKKLAQERNRNERLLSEMGPEMREINENLVISRKKVDQWQQEIDALNIKKASLNDHIYMFPMTYEAIRLESKLLDLQKKLKNIKRRTPKQSADDERKAIRDHVAIDNSQINIMESAINVMTKEIKNVEEILALSKDSEEGKGNRQLLYTELLKKEEAIENYLANYDISKQSINEKLKSIEDELLYTLKQLGNKLAFVPTPADYLYIQMDHSEPTDVLNTVKSIGTKCENLRQYLTKVEIMQGKLYDEFAILDTKIKSTTNELEEYKTCNKLNRMIDQKQNELIRIKSQVEISRQKVKDGLHVAKSLHDELLKQLNENEHQVQLFLLEKKLSNIGQNNFLMNDVIEEIKISANVKVHRNTTMDILQNMNLFLRNNVNL